MNQKSFVNIILFVVIVVLVGITGYFVLAKKSRLITQQQTPTPSQICDASTTMPPIIGSGNYGTETISNHVNPDDISHTHELRTYSSSEAPLGAESRSAIG